MSEKVRTRIYISEDLLRECDEYLSKNGGSRSELIIDVMFGRSENLK
jgi:metal-responsive CopG/Arc/MetJ family transcriptional regulator